MRTAVRLWRTEKDAELVLDGDPKAVALVYGENDVVESEHQAAASKLQPKGSKAEAPPENKSEPAPENKSEPAPAAGGDNAPAKPKARARKTAAPKK